MKQFYVKHKTEKEAKEIIELAVANGADEYETVENMGWRNWEYVGVNGDNDTELCDYRSNFGEYATEMTIEEVRKMFEKKSDVSDEYIPEVGEECFAQWLVLPDGGGMDSVVVSIKFIGSSIVVFENNGEERAMNLRYVSFQPLKTKDEIDREDEVIGLETILIDNHIGNSNYIAEILHKNGCRKLKEKEAIVKPLSDEQRSRIKEELRSYAATVEYAIDVVQREQGVIE